MEQSISEKKTIDLTAAFNDCNPRFQDWGGYTIPAAVGLVIISFGSFLIFPLGLVWSLFYMASRALDDKPVKISDLWEGPGKVGLMGAIIGSLVIAITPGAVMLVGSILTGILAKILGGVGAMIGGLLAVVAVIAISLALIYAMPIYVRQNCGAVEAMKRSVELFKANTGDSLKLFFVLVIINAVAGMIPLVGMLAAGPMCMLLLMHGYQQLEPEAASPAFAD